MALPHFIIGYCLGKKICVDCLVYRGAIFAGMLLIAKWLDSKET